MKKSIVALSVFLLSTTCIFSQVISEKKLNVKQVNVEQLAATIGRTDCNCTRSIIQDGGFENLSVGAGSNIIASSNPWKPYANTPQWYASAAACNNGFVSMWGNQTVGESIYQNGMPAGTYTVKITARFLNPTKLATFVRLKIFTYNGTGAPANYDQAGIVSPNISSTSWNSYTFSSQLTVAANQSIVLHPENDYTQIYGDYTSWIQVDNICIEPVCKIPDGQCNPQFNASPLTLNGQCNVIINVNPVITAGAIHYWGVVYASGISDNTPIPLNTILAGGTFGLSINSTGTVTSLGMGTGKTASTSGYGYHYEGFPLGKCFKITHYIKCCSKWYSRTITYCPKLCQETKESDTIELSPEEAAKADAALAVQGRG